MTYLSVCNPIRRPGWPMRFPTCPTKIPHSSSKPITGTALLLPTESRNPACHAFAEIFWRYWCNRQSDEVTICTRDPVDMCALASSLINYVPKCVQNNNFIPPPPLQTRVRRCCYKQTQYTAQTLVTSPHNLLSNIYFGQFISKIL